MNVDLFISEGERKNYAGVFLMRSNQLHQGPFAAPLLRLITMKYFYKAQNMEKDGTSDMPYHTQRIRCETLVLLFYLRHASHSCRFTLSLQ